MLSKAIMICIIHIRKSATITNNSYISTVLKMKVLQMVLHSVAIEEPFFVPHLFLTFL